MPARLSGLLWISNQEPFPVTARSNPAAVLAMPALLAAMASAA